MTESQKKVCGRIEEGLRGAAIEKGLSWNHASRIKRQKYTDQAVDQFTSEGEHPITRSWFKYGRAQPESPTGSIGDGLVSPETPESPESSDVYDEHDRQGESDEQHEIFALTESDFQDFFVQDADSPPLTTEYWQADNLEFLEEYYRKNAPAELREIYLENIRFRQIVSDVKQELDRIVDERESDKDSPSIGDRRYEDVQESTLDFRISLREHPEGWFDSMIDPIREFTDLVNNVFMKLSDLKKTEVRHQHYLVLLEIEEFYDEVVWMLIASKMSRETAVGPQAEELKSAADSTIREIEQDYEEDFTSLKNRCANAGLTASPRDFRVSSETSEEELVDEVMRIIDGVKRE
jgi:hypothetical protein